MAFEDRCSPQGAPSPPGLPHSPQNTTSPTEIMNHSNFNGNTVMSSSFHDRLSPLVIKQEEPSVEQTSFHEHQYHHHHHRVEQPQSHPIRFSISNILSENFGKASTTTTDTNSILTKKRSSDKKTSSSTLFRPYDIAAEDNTRTQHIRHQKIHHHQQPHQRSSLEEIKLSQFRINHEATIIDFSRQPHPATQSPLPHEVKHSMTTVDQHKLFNGFSVQQSYPKIHEEILNSKNLQRQYQLSNNALSDSSYAKIPPLGNLCKTVSQIGQATAAAACRSPVLSSSSSSASSTSSASVTPVKCDTGVAVRPKPMESQQPTPVSRDSGMESSDDAKSETGSTKDDGTQLWPAWVYCTRYSDRPSSGPRYRKPKQPKDKAQISDEKRPRTAFSSDQLARLKREFIENRYLTERRRQQLSAELGLNEAQIKIWFQNKRAKIKKTSGNKNPLALQLMAQGLYNHSTVPLTKEEEELEMRMNGQLP